MRLHDIEWQARTFEFQCFLQDKFSSTETSVPIKKYELRKLFIITQSRLKITITAAITPGFELGVETLLSNQEAGCKSASCSKKIIVHPEGITRSRVRFSNFYYFQKPRILGMAGIIRPWTKFFAPPTEIEPINPRFRGRRANHYTNSIHQHFSVLID